MAQGTGAGASQIAFAVAHYGVGEFLDLASLRGGPLVCPLCTADGSLPVEPLLSDSIEPSAWEATLAYPSTTVRFFIGDRESPAIADQALAFHDRVTTAKSRTSIADTGHDIEQAPAGVDALVSAALAARR